MEHSDSVQPISTGALANDTDIKKIILILECAAQGSGGINVPGGVLGKDRTWHLVPQST